MIGLAAAACSGVMAMIQLTRLPLLAFLQCPTIGSLVLGGGPTPANGSQERDRNRLSAVFRIQPYASLRENFAPAPPGSNWCLRSLLKGLATLTLVTLLTRKESRPLFPCLTPSRYVKHADCQCHAGSAPSVLPLSSVRAPSSRNFGPFVTVTLLMCRWLNLLTPI